MPHKTGDEHDQVDSVLTKIKSAILHGHHHHHQQQQQNDEEEQEQEQEQAADKKASNSDRVHHAPGMHTIDVMLDKLKPRALDSKLDATASRVYRMPDLTAEGRAVAVTVAAGEDAADGDGDAVPDRGSQAAETDPASVPVLAIM